MAILQASTKPANSYELHELHEGLLRDTFHEKPVAFLVPHEAFLDLVETLDELKDKRLLGEIERARLGYKQGQSVPAERLFKKMGL